MIGRLHTIVLDAADIDGLASFYEALLGWPRTRTDDDWIEMDSGTLRLACQLAPDHRPPRWPDPERPQQVHLDIEVDDMPAAEAAVIELGAQPLTASAEPGFRVFADPAGHPFCLVYAE